MSIFKISGKTGLASTYKWIILYTGKGSIQISCYVIEKMIDDTRTTKHFCQHTGTGDIFIVEVTWNRIVVGSYGPVQADDLNPPESYNCTTKINAWLEIQKDMLIII